MEMITKDEAVYVEHPRKNQGRCRDCTMYRPARCTLVYGLIDPDAHCKYFERKSGTKHG